MISFKSRLELDLEEFIRFLSKLEPVEFMGLAKVLCVRTLRDPKDLGVDLDEYVNKSEEEKEEIKNLLLVPTEEIMVEMIDKFASLKKRKRKEILSLLKDVQRGR